MIVSSGYNIGGPEVEAAIDSHPDVLESAVVGRPDAGARLRRLRLRRAQGRRARRRHGRRQSQGDPGPRQARQLAPYKYPRDVRFTAALPRNASGKLQHFALREILAKEQAAAERKGEPRP